MTQLILEFTELFIDMPGKVECMYHDVNVKHVIIKPSQCEWSSPGRLFTGNSVRTF